MTVFALITEGITDQAVIECILEGVFATDTEFAVNPLQPLRDATDETKSTGMAGWEKVFEYCETEHILDAFALNDFLIIQIDTDQGDHPNFGVPLTRHGRDRSVEDMIEETIKRLENKIGDEVCNEFGDRILYAISVHSTECWLYAHHAPANRKERTKQCYSQLENSLAKKILPL